ncbi:MAG: PatB family C-S lyase [Sedimentisphaerales bacterium]|nr:PatB family C-S lyase [Sedimentisphaerales bacterium]
MEYDFDKIIERRNTGSLKWDRYPDDKAISMWVADMDFQAPPAVLETLRKCVDYGIFGYSLPTKELAEVIIQTMEQKYGWSIEPEWIVWLPGLVTGLNLACRSVGDVDDEAISFTPVYPPFLAAPVQSKRTLLTVPLMLRDGQYVFDLEKLKKTITGKTRLLILCNPHNPVGRVFSREELLALAEICLENDIVICSDEIHCELVLDEVKHVPTASLSSEIADNTITLMSPSKTYNIPGLGCGFAIISNEKIRRDYVETEKGILSTPNALGYSACLAAYRDCEDWRLAVVDYLRKNREVVYDFIKGELAPLSMQKGQATYLAWIDARKLGMSNPAGFFSKGGVILSDGKDFGAPGFLRLNFACPQEVLREALYRMKQSLERL